MCGPINSAQIPALVIELPSPLYPRLLPESPSLPPGGVGNSISGIADGSTFQTTAALHQHRTLQKGRMFERTSRHIHYGGSPHLNTCRAQPR